MDIFIGAKLDELPLKNQGKIDKVSLTRETLPKEKHHLVMQFEKRKGKPVSLVGRFSLDEKELKDLAKKLKSTLACGESVEGEWILLQGDVRQKIKEILIGWGWKFKK